MASTVPESNEERRRKVLLGPLPAGFLQTGIGDNTDINDYQVAVAMSHQQMYGHTPNFPDVGRLSITVVQAKLVKNYGLTRMDPYVRMRIGHSIYETHTDPNAGKTPRWNKVIHCILPPGVSSIYMEIYDECSFSMDELIAWTHIALPTAVLNGETHEDWYPLNGKQGEGMEGMVNLVLSYSMGPGLPRYPPMMVVPHTGLGYAAMPMYAAAACPPQPCARPPPPPQLVAPPQATPEQIKLLEEMFPSIDKEVIKSVLEANNCDNDATVNSLLQLSE